MFLVSKIPTIKYVRYEHVLGICFVSVTMADPVDAKINETVTALDEFVISSPWNNSHSTLENSLFYVYVQRSSVKSRLEEMDFRHPVTLLGLQDVLGTDSISYLFRRVASLGQSSPFLGNPAPTVVLCAEYLGHCGFLTITRMAGSRKWMLLDSIHLSICQRFQRQRLQISWVSFCVCSQGRWPVWKICLLISSLS